MSTALLLVFVVTCSLALASSNGASTSLQDFCVAVSNSKVVVNGLVCKDPKLVVAEEFHQSGNALGFKVTPIPVAQLPGLNTMGSNLHGSSRLCSIWALIHFQRNLGNRTAVALAALNSQNPGSNPSISTGVLTKAFQVDQNLVAQLQAKF